MVAQTARFCPSVASGLVYNSAWQSLVVPTRVETRAVRQNFTLCSNISNRCNLRPVPQLLARRCPVCRAGAELIEPLQPLGVDFLKFLAAFVVITPVFKRLDLSPILGFLLAGLLLRQVKYEPCITYPAMWVNVCHD